MPKLSLNHLEAAVILAVCCSAVLGVVTRRVVSEGGVKVIRDASDRERIRYGLQCLAYFLGAILVLGWLMYLAHG